MYATPTLDGNAIFGLAVRIQVTLRPAAYHLAEFFGVDGVASVFGGKRGRLIAVEGSLIGADIPTLNLNEGVFETYVDGLSHTLTDTRGRAWTSVVFDGNFHVDPGGPRPLVGWYNIDGSNYVTIRYRAAFLALT